jgi:hypothetical protein
VWSFFKRLTEDVKGEIVPLENIAPSPTYIIGAGILTCFGEFPFTMLEF